MYKYAIQDLHRKQVHVSSVPRHCIPSEISRAIGDGTETRSRARFEVPSPSNVAFREPMHTTCDLVRTSGKFLAVLNNPTPVCLCVDVNKHKSQRERNKRNHNVSLSTMQNIYISFVISFLRLFVKIPSTETLHLTCFL